MGFQRVDLSEQKFMLSPETEASSRLDRAMQKACCLWPSKTPLTKRLIIFLWTNAENRLHNNILWWHLRREISGITRGLSTLQRLAEETDDAGDNSKYVQVMGPPPRKVQLNSPFACAAGCHFFLSFQFLFTHFNTSFSDCTKQCMTDWRLTQIVLCHFSSKGLHFFFKDTSHVLQFCFSHIIYHRPEKVEGTSYMTICRLIWEISIASSIPFPTAVLHWL